MNAEPALPKIGEVIEASTASFTAQSYELWELPPLGSLVRTSDGGLELYGLVCRATTSGIEPGRKAIARGKDEATEEGVFQANPQLARLLKSEFTVLLVGFKDGVAMRRYLPPHPARIHAFVYQCSPAETLVFSEKLDFLNIVLKSEVDIPAEEFAGAVLRQLAESQQNRHGFLVEAGRELARLLSKDYSQLKAILERIKP